MWTSLEGHDWVAHNNRRPLPDFQKSWWHVWALADTSILRDSGSLYRIKPYTPDSATATKTLTVKAIPSHEGLASRKLL